MYWLFINFVPMSFYKLGLYCMNRWFPPYLTHLAVERNCCNAEISQQQCQPLGIVARAAKNYEWVSGKFVQDGNQITILQRKCTEILKHCFTSGRTITELWQYFHIRTYNNVTYLVLWWYENVVLLKFVYRGIFAWDCTLYRVFQGCSL